MWRSLEFEAANRSCRPGEFAERTIVFAGAACAWNGWMDCQGASDKRKTLIRDHVVQSSARLHRGRAEKGWKHACTEGNLVRVRTADRLREGAPAGQGERHEHAALHERRQRQAPGHHLGRIRANRKQPQPRRIREWRFVEVDTQTPTPPKSKKKMWGTASAAPPPPTLSPHPEPPLNGPAPFFRPH